MRRRLLLLSCAGLLLLSMLAGCKDASTAEKAVEDKVETAYDSAKEKGTITLLFTNKAFDEIYETEREYDLSGLNIRQKMKAVLWELRDEERSVREEESWYSVIPSTVMFQAEYNPSRTGGESNSKIVITFLRGTSSLTQNQRVVMYTGISQALLALNIAPTVEFIEKDSDEVLYTAKKSQEVSINVYDEEYFTGTKTVNLYFANKNGTALYREKRDIYLGVSDSLAKVVMQALLAGPTESSGVSTIPTGTEVNDIFVKDNVCYLDLSSEFQRNYIGSETMEKLTVYSIVNSLCGVPGINQVQILIDGKRVDIYKFSISLNSFFERDLSLVE